MLGKEYRSFETQRRWELLFEDVLVVILNTGVRRGRDSNLVGIASDDLRVRWVISGELDIPDQYDGIVNVYVRKGSLWAGTWSGYHYRINHQTGAILERIFRK